MEPESETTPISVTLGMVTATVIILIVLNIMVTAMDPGTDTLATTQAALATALGTATPATTRATLVTDTATATDITLPTAMATTLLSRLMVWASCTLLKDMVTVTTTSVTLATVDSTDTATTASTTGRRSTTP